MFDPTARSHRPLIALALVFTVHCGGTQTTTATTTTTATGRATDGGATMVGSTGANADVAWGSLGQPDLERLVTEGARAQLTELAPQFDMTRIAEYAATPALAPELSGHAVERLLDLATVELAANRNETAEQIVRVVRARARNRNSAYVGNSIIAEAHRRAAGNDAEAQHAIEVVFRELPPERFNAATVVYQIFQRQQQLEARLERVHQSMVTMDTAKEALYYSAVAPLIVAHRARYLAAIDTVRAENAARPPRAEYVFSTVDLAGATDAHEVPIAVWDLGTNPRLFERQMLINAAEQANGRDDDGNGQIDDISGIVSDGTAPNTALLFEPTADTLTRYTPYLRGVMDLRAGMATTPAAQQVLELVRTVTSAEQQRELDRRLDNIGEWAHGTHVAGIMTAGLPQARLAVFRSAWAGESRLYEDRGPTDAELEAEQRNMQAVAGFIRGHHIKVVNASLGFSIDYLEQALRHETAVYRNDTEVRARARAVQARRRGSWAEVFTSCPDTLFVVAAGNSNQDIVEYEDIPSSIQAPNVLPVGAVDRFGDWAVFTNSNPERVRIFDHGVEVDSVIPSGDHVPLSGTSMASPNVANLAAKLFSIDPTLTPVRAIEVMVDTGDAIAAPFNGRIAHERHAIERVRQALTPAVAAPPPGAHPAHVHAPPRVHSTPAAARPRH